ncbi:MAG: HEAT repeat domain-containing protein [Candidatus Hodarchaeales archaeon]
MSEFNDLESSDRGARERAARSLGQQRTKASLRALLETVEKDNDKDVRKTAIESIQKLNDPEALSVLKGVQDKDKDRGVRNKAKEAVKSIEASGASIPESDGFSESDAQRARDDYRALEEHEKTQAGLHVKLEESLKYRIDQENNLVNEDNAPIESFKGTGKIIVANAGSKDRIWAIDATLTGVDGVHFEADEEQGTAVFGNSFALKELDPQGQKYVPFDFETRAPKLKLVEDFWDLEKTDSPPTFSRGTDAGMRFTIELTNEFDWPVNEVVLKKYIPDSSTDIGSFQTDQGTLGEDSDEEGRFILWKIEEILSMEKATASCEFRVTMDEESNEPYSVGDTVVTYKCLENTLSNLGLETITGSSSVFQFISRDEQEENPGDFDCKFELENTSEFEMDLKEIRIFEGPLDEGNVRLEWLGTDFAEEERSIDSGETFTLDPWTITVEDDGVIPQFGRELDLSVKYLFDAEIISECVLPGYNLPFMDIEVSKSYSVTTIPSFRRTEVITENIVKSIGSTEVQYIQLQDTIPDGFEPPEFNSVEILKGDTQMREGDFTFEISENNIILTMEHLEDTLMETLKQEEELLVKYPIFATSPKPDEEFTGNLTVLANIYPPVKPVSAETETDPITVIHARRKLKIGKMVSSTANEGSNEYEIIIRGVNEGTAVIQNVEVSDFLPKGFELVSETEEDPPVGFEEHSSVKGGKAMKWIYEEVQPEQKVEIRFKIRAPGEHDPKDVYRMLLG